MPGTDAEYSDPEESHALRRTLSLSLVTYYGLGNILGAGSYVMIDKVAG